MPLPKVPTLAPSARRLLIISALLAAPLWMAWYGLRWWQNVPESDEFVTVLHFLGRFDRSATLAEKIHLLLDSSNEHRTLTSRLLFIGIHGVFGSVNFAALAVLGCLFGAATVLIVALTPKDTRARWLLGVLFSAALFNLQHFENLFSSCASIDHLLVVLLTTATLALLTRANRTAVLGSVACGGLAIFTLVQGFAVVPAGALLLASQRRWNDLAGWLTGMTLFGLLFFAGHNATAGLSAQLTAGSAGKNIAAFWVVLTGGMPSLGQVWVAAAAGVASLAWFALLSFRGAWRREPFLMALAFCALVSIGAIAAGRAGTSTPMLSSRYLVQSAVFWGALVAVTLLVVSRGRGFRLGAPLAAGLVLALSAASNYRYYDDAAHYSNRRTVAALHYDRTGSLVGLKHPIFPVPDKADGFLWISELARIFVLRPPPSPPITLSTEPVDHPLVLQVEQTKVGRKLVHVSGWVALPPGGEPRPTPVLLLQGGPVELAFAAAAVPRPDVARMFALPDVTGFSFVVPKDLFDSAPRRIAIGLDDGRRVLLVATDQIVGPSSLAGKRKIVLQHAPSAPRPAPSAVVMQPMSYQFAPIQADDSLVRIQGWAVPPADVSPGAVPVLLLHNGEAERAFTGFPLSRPDVATAFGRPPSTSCGFAFNLPPDLLGPGRWKLDLAYADGQRLTSSATDKTLVLTPGNPGWSAALRARISPIAADLPSAQHRPMDYRLDPLTVVDGLVQLHGWLLPPAGTPANASPVLLLHQGETSRAFRGIGLHRPDVAANFQRADAGFGFSFGLARASLRPGRWQMQLAYEAGSRLICSETVEDLFLAADDAGQPDGLLARISPEIGESWPDVRLQPMNHRLDPLASAEDLVLIRGWILPPPGLAPGATPVLLLRRDTTTRSFRGSVVSRPDVAKAFRRDDDALGFAFAVPRDPVESGTWTVDLGYDDGTRLVYSETNQVLDLAAGTARDRDSPRNFLSPLVAELPPRVKRAMTYFIDRMSATGSFFEVRGWLLAPPDVPPGTGTIVVLRNGDQEYAFRGTPVGRPDVAAVHGRTDDPESGFVVRLPQSILGTQSWQVSLGFDLGQRTVYTHTDHVVVSPLAEESAKPASENTSH